MTTIAQWSGDSLSAGGSVTTSTVGTGDTAFTAVNSDANNTLTLATAPSGRGVGIEVAKTATSGTATVNYGSLSSLTATGGRFAFKTPSAWGSGAQMIVAATGASSANCWRIYITSTGKLRIYGKAGSQVGSDSTVALSASTAYRIEWLQDGDTLTVNAYLGDNTSVVATTTYTDAVNHPFNTAITLVRFGYIASIVLGAGIFDDILLTNTAALPGPVVVNNLYAGRQSFDGDPADIAFDVNSGTALVTSGGTDAFAGDGAEVAVASAVNRHRWSTTTFGAGKTYWATTFRFMVPALPDPALLGGTDASVLTVKNTNPSGGTGLGHFGIFIKSDGKLHWDLLATDTDYYDKVLEPGRWYTVQAKGYYGGTTYTAEVLVDGSGPAAIDSTGMTAYETSAIGFGSDSTVQTYTYFIDDVKFATDTVAIAFLTPLTAVNENAAVLPYGEIFVGEISDTAPDAALMGWPVGWYWYEPDTATLHRWNGTAFS